MNRDELLAFFERREIDTRHIPSDVLEHARKVVEASKVANPIYLFMGNGLS